MMALGGLCSSLIPEGKVFLVEDAAVSNDDSMTLSAADSAGGTKPVTRL